MDMLHIPETHKTKSETGASAYPSSPYKIR